MMDEFRRALELIVRYPGARQQLDDAHRRCRLHRFPYGIIYRRVGDPERIVVVAVMHLARHDDQWRGR